MGMLDPIEGVSIQDYARLVARVVAGEEQRAVLESAGIDPARYDRIAEGWNARMADDPTFTVAGEYGKAFLPASNEARGTTEQQAWSWEQYVEATEAMSAGTAAGADPQSVLAKLGMGLSDYVNAGNHWMPRFEARCRTDPSALEEFAALQARYRAKYAAAGTADDDLKF